MPDKPNRDDWSYNTAPPPSSTPGTSGTPGYQAPGAMQGWLGTKSQKENAQADISNALLPYLSPSDKITTAKWLSGQDEAYKPYANLELPAAPAAFTPEQRNYFLSKQRAADALASLENLRNFTGKSEEQMGAGYKFIRQMVDLLNTFGGQGTAMSKAQFAQFSTTANDLLATVQNDQNLAPYGSIAQTFLFPGGSGGLMGSHTTLTGEKLPGAPNAKFYG